MASRDYIYRSFLSGTAIVLVIPGRVIDSLVLEQARARADALSRSLSFIRDSDIATYTSGLDFDPVPSIRAAFRRSSVRNPSSVTLRDLFAAAGLPPATDGGTSFSRASLVIYFDPDLPDVTSRSRVIRTPSRPEGVTLLQVSATSPTGHYWEEIPYLLSALYEAGAASRGGDPDEIAARSRAVLVRARGYETREQTRFLTDERGDRIGFDHIIEGVTATGEGEAPVSRILAETKTHLLDGPVLRLELEDGRLHLHGGPLSNRAYRFPGAGRAREILLEILRGVDSRISVTDLATAYNAALKERLGDAGRVFRLRAKPGADLQLQVPEPEAVRVESRPTLFLPYASIGSDAFGESLKTEAARARHLSSRTLARHLVDGLEGLSQQNHLDRYHEHASPELQAFAYQLFFEEFQWQAGRGNPDEPARTDVAFQFSREDAAYSILSRREVWLLRKWFHVPENKERMRSWLESAGLVTDQNPSPWIRIRNLLTHVLDDRIDTGRTQLWVDPEGELRKSPKPDDSGRIIVHSSLYPEERRPVLVGGDTLRVGVRYLQDGGPLAGLWHDVATGEENSGLRLYDALVPDRYHPTPYEVAASEFEGRAASLLLEGPALSPEALGLRVADLISDMETLPSVLDGNGRVPEAAGRWWERVQDVASKLAGLAADLPDPALALRLKASVKSIFHVDSDLQVDPQRVRFADGTFHTWRGAITSEETGIPEGWKPGDPLRGYRITNNGPSVYEYEAQFADGALPERFRMTWNGLPYPPEVLEDLPARENVPARTATFEDRRGEVPVHRTWEIPEILQPLPGADSHWFGFDLDGMPGVRFIVDGYAYVNTEGELQGDLVSDVAFFRRLALFMARTHGGREILSRLESRARIQASDFKPETRIANLDPARIVGEGGYSLLIQVQPDRNLVAALGAEGVTGRPLQASTPALNQFIRALGAIAFDVAEIPVPPGESAREFQRSFTLGIVNSVLSEMGRGYRSRWKKSDRGIEVPLDGSVLALDENLEPISLVRLREQTVLNRYFALFSETALTLDPDIRKQTLSIENALETIPRIVDHLEAKAGARPSFEENARLLELRALQRQILSALKREAAAGDLEAAGQYRQAPLEGVSEPEVLLDEAKTRWRAWNARVDVLLADGGLSDRVRGFIQNEIVLLAGKERTASEIRSWMGRLSSEQKEFALLRLQIAADTNPDPEVESILDAHEGELAALGAEIDLLRTEVRARKAESRAQYQELLQSIDRAIEAQTDPIRFRQEIRLRTGARYVLFKEGVQVDEFGLPVLPGSLDALFASQLKRVVRRFGKTFTGRIRMQGLEMTEVPMGEIAAVDRKAELNTMAVNSLLLASPAPEGGEDRRLDLASRIAVSKAVEDGRVERLAELLPPVPGKTDATRKAVKKIADSAAESVQIQLEVKRDHARLVKAVIEKIRAYNEETGGDWVMVPDSEVFDGNDIHFKVVERSAVTAGASSEDPPVIPDSARKVRLTVNTEGLLVSPGLLEKKKAEAERLANGENGEEGEGAGRFDGVKSAVGVTTFAGGLMLAGIGFLQAIRGLEEHENWETVYGAATATYFAGHAGVGGLAQAFKTSLGKRLIAGATDLLESATDSAIEGIAKLTGKTVVEVAAKLGKFGAIAARGASSVAGVIGEIIPFVGVAVGAVMIGLDTLHLAEAKTTIEKVQYGTDLAFDTIVTVVDVIGSAFPPAEIVTAPLSLIINITRMIFDSAIVEVQAELAKLPDDATDDEKALAVVNGIGFGIRDFIRNLTPWAAIEDSIKIDREHNQDLAYIHSLNDPATYFGIHPVDGVTGETALDFEIGSNSLSGGDVVAHLGEPGAETTISIGDVPVNQLASGDGTLATHSLDWRGVLSANTDFVMLGFGESYAIETTAAKAYLFWAIPVDTQTVISGTGDNRASRVGTYFGNSRDNTFIGPTIASLADEDGDTEDERTRKADMRTTLRTYHYNLHGGAGDDTFMVGGAVSHLHGDAGRDTYIINENNYFYIHNEAEDRLTDTLVLSNQLLFRLGIEINPWQLAEQADNLGINYMGHTADGAHPTESTIGLLVDYLESDLHQHLQIRTQDGYVITLDGDHLASERDAGRRHYVLRSEDITGLFLNEHQGPTFDADQRTVSVYESGSVVTRRTGQTATTTPARFQTLRLHHIENIFGDERTNTLSGNALANYIHGGDGNDYLYGRGGDDILVGGAAGIDTPGTIMSLLSGGDGNDTLISSPERSQLFGGAGQDTYILHEGISTVEIRDVADEKNNLVKLPIAARNLRSSVEGTTLVLRDGTDADRVVRVLEWTTRGALYEFHTGDGFIYLKDGNGLSLGGFDGNTFRTREVDTGVSASQGGFAVEVYDLPTGAGRPTLPASFDRVLTSGRLVAEGRITGIDFEGGTPPRFRFDMDAVSAIRNWVIEKEARRALLPENAQFLQADRHTDAGIFATFVRRILGLTRPPGQSVVDIADIRDHFIGEGEFLPESWFSRMGTGTPPAVNTFLGLPGLSTGTRTIESAGLIRMVSHIWLDRGRHDFRLTSSQNAFVRINGEILVRGSFGAVEEGGNSQRKWGHVEVETPGFHEIEILYANNGDTGFPDRDNAKRLSSLPEHYLKFEIENGQGEFHVLGTGTDDILVRDLASLPNAHLMGDTGIVFDGMRAEYRGISRIIGSETDDTLTGNTLDNQIFGAGGSDLLSGGEGADIYHVDEDGIDTIRNRATDGKTDTAYLPGTRAEITFTVAENRHLEVLKSGTVIARVEDWGTHPEHRHIRFHTTDGTVLGLRFEDSDGTITATPFITAVDFTERTAGVTWDGRSGTEYAEVTTILGSDFDDRVDGNSLDNTLTGGAGNDTLRGHGGDDILYAGAGADTLEGGEGADSYVVPLSEMTTTVTIRNGQTGEGQNILRIHANRSHVRMARDGDHLVINGARYQEGTVRIVVEDWYTDETVRNLAIATDDDWLFTISGDPPVIDRIELNYGTETTGQTIDLTNTGIFGTGIRKVTGSREADVITGNGEDNLLIGGGGADHLTGGMGADVYVVGEEAGEVVIDNRTEDGAHDVIVLSMDRTRLSRTRIAGDDLLVETSAGTTLRLSGWRTDPDARDITLIADGWSYAIDSDGHFVLESVDLSSAATGQTLTLGDGASGISGSDFDDDLAGNSQDNHLAGGDGGMDRLSGLQGSDIYAVELEADSATLPYAATATRNEIIEQVSRAGGRYIRIANRATDGKIDRILATGRSQDEIRSLRIGNDLLLFALTAGETLAAGRIPTEAVLVEDWFASSENRHLAVMTPMDGLVVEIGDTGTLGDVIEIDDSSVAVGKTRDLSGDAYSRVLRVTDSPFDDAYTGNDASDLLVSHSGDDRLVGGRGEDTFYITGIDAAAPRTVTVRNGGDDGRTDLVFLDMERTAFTHTRLRDDGFLEIHASGITLVLEDWDSGTEDAPAFQIATRGGITYEIRDDGHLAVLSVDVSDQETVRVDASGTFDPEAADASAVRIHGEGAMAIPTTLAGAGLLKGGTKSETLIGGDGENTLISGGTGETAERLVGGGGKDLYVLTETGNFTIDNRDAGKAQDTAKIDVDFNDLQGRRDEGDLVLESPFGFTLRVLGFFGAETARHLLFVTRDGVLFDISGPDLEVADATVVLKTVRGLDLSTTTDAVTLDLTETGRFRNARMEATSFAGSKTARSVVTLGDFGSQVATGTANDAVTTGIGNDILNTKSGNDEIHSGGGDDAIFAGAGHDVIHAGDGDDVIVGNTGEDRIDGGEGSDTVSFVGDVASATGVTVNLNDGTGRDADAEGDTYTDIENVYGTPFDDVLIGDFMGNLLVGNDGNDRLEGREGDDILAPGDGSDFVHGGDGTDTVRYADLATGIDLDLSRGTARHLDENRRPGADQDTLIAIENVEGTAHSDRILGDDGDNLVLGSFGADRIALEGGTDTVDYSLLAFTGKFGVRIDLAATPFVDTPIIPTFEGDDTDYLVQWLTGVEAIRGSVVADRLFGTEAGDIFDGDAGIDTLRGRGGDDFFFGRADGDLLHGGEGRDTVSYARIAEGVTASLRTGFGGGLDQLVSIENLEGSRFADLLEGDASANRLDGDLGLDILLGGDGNDRLSGPGDGDLLVGGEGEDTADFRNASHGVSVKLGARQFTDAAFAWWQGLDSRFDYLVGIETVHGSMHADLIHGSRLHGETVFGEEGDDWISGSTQGESLDWGVHADVRALAPPPTPIRDLLDGGDGFDVASYAEAEAGVYGHLGLGRAGGDLLVSIEGIEGSRHADILMGSEEGNRLLGGAGDDVLSGGRGDDAISGGTGDDRFHFSAGDGTDTVSDSGGQDRLLLHGFGIPDLAVWREEDALHIAAEDGNGIVIESQFAENGAVEEIRLDGGAILTATAAEGLVAAMARFGGGTAIDSAQAVFANPELLQLVASAWNG